MRAVGTHANTLDVSFSLSLALWILGLSITLSSLPWSAIKTMCQCDFYVFSPHGDWHPHVAKISLSPSLTFLSGFCVMAENARKSTSHHVIHSTRKYFCALSFQCDCRSVVALRNDVHASSSSKHFSQSLCSTLFAWPLVIMTTAAKESSGLQWPKNSSRTVLQKTFFSRLPIVLEPLFPATRRWSTALSFPTRSFCCFSKWWKAPRRQ